MGVLSPKVCASSPLPSTDVVRYGVVWCSVVWRSVVRRGLGATRRGQKLHLKPQHLCPLPDPNPTLAS